MWQDGLRCRFGEENTALGENFIRRSPVPFDLRAVRGLVGSSAMTKCQRRLLGVSLSFALATLHIAPAGRPRVT